MCGQLAMQLRVRAKVVALIDFEVDLTLAMLVDRWLFNRDGAEHLTLIATFAQNDLILCEETFRVSVLKICEAQSDRECAIFKVEVGVLALCQNTQDINAFSLTNDCMDIIDSHLVLGLGRCRCVCKLWFHEHITVGENGLFDH